jgi:hypothetical protein
MPTVIEELHQQKATIAALTAENAKLKAGAPAQATAQASTANTSGPFTNRADCERAYCSIQGEGLALAKAKAAFREKHKALLGL